MQEIISTIYTQIAIFVSMNFDIKTFHQFHDFFRNEKNCYEFLEKMRWASGPVCPECGSKKYYKVTPRGKFKDIPSYRCANRECDLPFTVRTKSIFEGSKIELRKWFLALYEIATCKKGISSIELGTRIGVSQKTAWLINHKLRTLLEEINPKLLKHVVQLDETLVGGKNKNKHADKKIPHSQGRSSKGKTTVFGVRGLMGEVRTRVVPDVSSETLIPIVDKWVEKGSITVTDEWRSYYALRNDYFHVSINHETGEYVSGAFSSNGIENFWSLFKRGIIGVFHRISEKHTQKYLHEFEFRYNNKDASNITLFEKAIQKTGKTQLTYRELTVTKKLKS